MGFRYIGTKTRMVDEIVAGIMSTVGEGAHVADLMSGTATVSAALRKNGFRVTANDVMTYSYHHARVALMFTAPPCFKNASNFVDEFSPKESRKRLFPLSPYERMLDALSNVPDEKGYFWREFSLSGSPEDTDRPRNYFSSENAKRIDAMRSWIRRLHETGQIDDLEHSLLIHDLIMAANDIANIAGTYGHYLSSLVGRANDRISLKPTPLILLNDSGRHTVLQGYAEKVAKGIACDLCYIDPPYMKRQYAANYHVLETLAREDSPPAIGVSGLRPWRDQYSNFCTKTRIRGSFREILSSMNCSHYLMSYSQDGLLGLDEIEQLLAEFGDACTRTFSQKRFKSNESSLEPVLSEYLLYLRITR